MSTEEFYEIIDHELTELISKYSEDEFIKRHKTKAGNNNQKSYALLIWFLDFYGKKSSYAPYITDGSNDGSCDIIFDGYDNRGDRVFYVVQSKWNNQSNSAG